MRYRNTLFELHDLSLLRGWPRLLAARAGHAGSLSVCSHSLPVFMPVSLPVHR